MKTSKAKAKSIGWISRSSHFMDITGPSKVHVGKPGRFTISFSKSGKKEINYMVESSLYYLYHH